MDTLLILRDTITSYLIKIVDSCHPCVQEVETNWADVSITNSICSKLFWIVVTCVAGFVIWKIADRWFEVRKDCRQREWDFMELKWKQRADLINKLLDFLKDKAFEKKDNKGQPAKNDCSSFKVDDIYKMLMENSAMSCSDDLRQQYVKLCVDILKKTKAEDHGGKQQNPSPTPQDGNPDPQTADGDSAPVKAEENRDHLSPTPQDENPAPQTADGDSTPVKAEENGDYLSPTPQNGTPAPKTAEDGGASVKVAEKGHQGKRCDDIGLSNKCECFYINVLYRLICILQKDLFKKSEGLSDSCKLGCPICCT